MVTTPQPSRNSPDAPAGTYQQTPTTRTQRVQKLQRPDVVDIPMLYATDPGECRYWPLKRSPGSYGGRDNNNGLRRQRPEPDALGVRVLDGAVRSSS